MADLRLVPPGIDDAVSRAINLLLDRFDALDVAAVLVSLVDRQSDLVLEYLAWEHHIDFWDLATTREAKIAMIQACYDAHRYKGTRAGLEQLFAMLDTSGTVAEWFEYGGDPYYFRVDLVWRGRTWDGSVGDKMLDWIDRLKNVRSWLDRLRVIPETTATTHAAAVSWSDTTITLRPPLARDVMAVGLPHAGVGCMATGYTTLYPALAG